MRQAGAAAPDDVARRKGARCAVPGATFDSACAKLGLAPTVDRATEFVALKIAELAKPGVKGGDLTRMQSGSSGPPPMKGRHPNGSRAPEPPPRSISSAMSDSSSPISLRFDLEGVPRCFLAALGKLSKTRRILWIQAWIVDLDSGKA
jgi:hypothetical protein